MVGCDPYYSKQKTKRNSYQKIYCFLIMHIKCYVSGLIQSKSLSLEV